MIRISRLTSNQIILPLYSRGLDLVRESQRKVLQGRFYKFPYARLVSLHGQRLATSTQNDYFLLVPNSVVHRGLYQRWTITADNHGITDIPPGYYRLDCQGYDEAVEYHLGTVRKVADQISVDAPGQSNIATTTLGSFFCYVEERYPYEIQEGLKFGTGDTEPAFVIPATNGF
jgi:hypothetical protein